MFRAVLYSQNLISRFSALLYYYDQISAIQEAFAYFDSNKDGLISFHEFQQILTSFGENVSDNEIGERIRMWDGDGDGKINFAEFLVAMAQILTDTENEERMREAFRIFDKVNIVTTIDIGVRVDPFPTLFDPK